MRLFKSTTKSKRRESLPATTTTSGATVAPTTKSSSSKISTASSTEASRAAAVSTFLSKHYDAIYVSTEDEDSGPYVSSMTTTRKLTTNCKEIPTIVAAPIYTQYPQSALSARIRQFTRGHHPPGGTTKRDSGDSELSVRFADQLVTTTSSRKKHRVEFKSTTSEGGDYYDGRSNSAKTTVSCPPQATNSATQVRQHHDKFDYKSYVNYIVQVGSQIYFIIAVFFLLLCFHLIYCLYFSHDENLTMNCKNLG